MNTYLKKCIGMTLAILISLSAVLSDAAYAEEKINFSYIYSVPKSDYITQVDKTNNGVHIISPNYYDVAEDGSLVTTDKFDSNFIEEMHKRGVKVVPYLSNHWDRKSGINALKNPEVLASKLVDEISKHNLHGINIDLENLTHNERDSFTQFIKLLSEKMPEGKELSVAVAANPRGLTKGWHGSYDYHALAQYADYLIIMTYDESYSGSDPGPVASIDFVEKSIQYASNQGVEHSKILLGIPFYGRIWRLEDLDSRKGVVGSGIWMDRTFTLLNNYGGMFQYSQEKGSNVGRVTITENDPPFQLFSWTAPLKPGNYEIWFDNEQSIQQKLDLVSKYNLKGAANWSLGQESDSLWAQYKTWLNPTIIASNQPENEENTSPIVPQYPNQSSPSVQTDSTRIDVLINGELLSFKDEEPIIESGRTLVPLREIFEALGASVQWDGVNKEITATKGNHSVWLKADSNVTLVNGETKSIEVPAQIRNGRTMVPLRFISESLNAVVNWNKDTRTASINM